MTTPGRTTVYKGPITDTSRWENFRHRPDDVFICTPPKCGTTWTQAIVAMLVFGTPEHGQQPGNVSPWIDANFAPIDEYLAQIEQQDHRRFIKTHTPMDGIPYFPECTYLVVCRDPRDMFFSLLNHRDNMADEALAGAIMPYREDVWDRWVEGSLDPDNFDIQSIETPTHFLKTYWAQRDLPNVHFMHYYDMKQDLRRHMAKVAALLGVTLDDAMLDAMTAAATFENMQAKGDQFAPGTGTGQWKKDASFFATGTNAQWKGRLDDAQLARFDARIGELLDDEQRAWLLRS